MRAMVRLMVCCCLIVAAGVTMAQPPEMPKASPEHALLKKYVGTWDATFKMMGQESKCTHTFEMVGDFWVMGKFSGNLMGMKLEGRDTLGWDPIKKKYVSNWIDNMSPHYTVMTGTFDAASKTMTNEGGGYGPDGKPTKNKDTAVWKSDDEYTFTMFEEKGGKWEEMFVIEYKRKK
jgi:hypothetical protein